MFYETVVRWGPSDDFGVFTFNQGVFTGSAFGDFLLGLPNTSFIVENSPNTNEGAVHWGLYGQDTWQVTRNLTVNFGLRWELNPKFSEATGDITNLLPIKGGEVVVPDNVATTVASTSLLQANNNGGPLFQFPATSPTNQALQYGGTGFYDAYNPYLV